MVARIRYINITAAVYGYTRGLLKLTVAATLTAPFGHKNTIAIKLLDAMVAKICYINITATVHGHARGVIELAVAAAIASAAPLS